MCISMQLYDAMHSGVLRWRCGANADRAELLIRASLKHSVASLLYTCLQMQDHTLVHACASECIA